MRHIILTLLLLLVSGGAWAEDTIPIQTLILEAQGEGFEGMRAVGEVIRNRANKAHSTFEGVCLAPRQFSCWNDRGEALKRLKRVSQGTFNLAKRAWDASATSLETQGSRHYHTKAVSPYWAKGKRPTVIIGQHVFYNNVK